MFDLHNAPGSFDIELGLNVLHLISNWGATIRRVYELLAPGGVFTSSTACISSANFLLRKLLPIGGKLGVIPEVEIFSNETLASEIRDAGFTIIQNSKLNKSGMNAFIIARK